MEMSYLASIIVFLAALVCLTLRSNAKLVTNIGIASSSLLCVLLMMTTMVPLAMPTLEFRTSLEIGKVMQLAIAGSALICIISQHRASGASKSVTSILFVCGLSVACLNDSFSRTVQLFALVCILVLLALFSLNEERANNSSRIVVVSSSILTLLLTCSSVVQEPLSAVFVIFSACVLLPLFPVHGAFVSAVSSFSGSFGSFLAVVLPCLGYSLISRCAIPQGFSETVVVLAILGAIVTMLRGAVQIDLGRIVAALGAVLFSIAWLSIGIEGKASLETGCYVLSVSTAISGLMLCAHHLDSIYGTLMLENLRGLSQSMPRLSAMVCVFSIAAAGFPPFAVSTMFLSVLLKANQPSMILLATSVYLGCSLLLASLMPKLLFGPKRSDLVYRDITVSDMCALIALALALLLGGLIPCFASPMNQEARLKEHNMMLKSKATKRNSPSSFFPSEHSSALANQLIAHTL
jgi:hypothetical protein